MNFIPHVHTKINGTETLVSIQQYEFIKKRIIHLNSPIDTDVATMICSQLMYLSSRSNDDIIMIINSPGGAVNAGLCIYDCMQHCMQFCDIQTIATGTAASMGAFLLAAGTSGKRRATANTNIMIHQPIGGASGQAVDIRIETENILRIKKQLDITLAKHTGHSLEETEEKTDRNYYMTAEEAMKYGIIDEVLGGAKHE